MLESYQHIRIGSIVASRPSSQPLESNEFQYDSYVYQLPPIPALLDKFGGKVIDEVMRGESKEQRVSEDSVYATWRRGDLCVKLTRPKYCVARREAVKPLRSIDARELRACDGEEEDEWYNEGWVAIGEDVYNLTSKLPLSLMLRPSLMSPSRYPAWPSEPSRHNQTLSRRPSYQHPGGRLDTESISLPRCRQAN